jgi:hypothetical protein
LLLLAALLILLELLNSCSHSRGPKVDGCVVDSIHLNYECIDSEDEPISLKFSESDSLRCSSPKESESFFKACKVGQVKQIWLCSYQNEAKNFACSKEGSLGFNLSIEETDNYLCFSDQHRQRIIERCRMN